jgi:hypothetical protein
LASGISAFVHYDIAQWQQQQRSAPSVFPSARRRGNGVV